MGERPRGGREGTGEAGIIDFSVQLVRGELYSISPSSEGLFLNNGVNCGQLE